MPLISRVVPVTLNLTLAVVFIILYEIIYLRNQADRFLGTVVFDPYFSNLSAQLASHKLFEDAHNISLYGREGNSLIKDGYDINKTALPFTIPTNRTPSRNIPSCITQARNTGSNIIPPTNGIPSNTDTSSSTGSNCEPSSSAGSNNTQTCTRGALSNTTTSCSNSTSSMPSNIQKSTVKNNKFSDTDEMEPPITNISSTISAFEKAQSLQKQFILHSSGNTMPPAHMLHDCNKVFKWYHTNISEFPEDHNKSKQLDKGYNLIGGGGISVVAVQKHLRECQQAMGLTQESNMIAINSLARNLTLYLNALRSIIPEHFSSSYHSPCWNSPIILSDQKQRELTLLSKQWIPMECQNKLKDHLIYSILIPSLNQENRALQCLPAFFLAGFPKSGTTTLYSMLCKHEMILKTHPKESHWWTRMRLDDKDPNYLRLAALRYLVYYNKVIPRVKSNSQVLTFDASQSTLWDSNFFVHNEDYCAMPIAVSHILPSAKFIVLMRDPVTRTLSHYLYTCTFLRKKPPSNSVFHEKVLSDVHHFKNCLMSNRTVYECSADKFYSRVNKAGCGGALGFHLIISIYYLHIKKWMQFYPRESFLFLRMEDMSSLPFTFMKKVTNFLNIDPLPYKTTKMLAKHKENRQILHMEMLPETRAILSEFFNPFNEMLVELTGDKRFLWKNTMLH